MVELWKKDHSFSSFQLLQKGKLQLVHLVANPCLMLTKRQRQVLLEFHVHHPYLQKASLKANLMTPWTQLCLLLIMPMLMSTGFPILYSTAIWRGDLQLLHLIIIGKQIF